MSPILFGKEQVVSAKEVTLITITGKRKFQREGSPVWPIPPVLMEPESPEDKKGLENKKRILKMVEKLSSLETETRFNEKRQETHMNCRTPSNLANPALSFLMDWVALMSSNYKLYIFSIVESLAIIGAALWNFSYLKRVLDNKCIV